MKSPPSAMPSNGAGGVNTLANYRIEEKQRLQLQDTIFYGATL